MLVQDGKLACVSFPPWCNDVIRDALVFVQDRKLACPRFPPWWDDVRDALVLA